jgi:hypothetical protein
MIGKNTALQHAVSGPSFNSRGEMGLPECAKHNHDYNGQKSDGPSFGFLKDLYQAIHESRKPQKPFQERGDHDNTNNGHIDNL